MFSYTNTINIFCYNLVRVDWTFIYNCDLSFVVLVGLLWILFCLTDVNKIVYLVINLALLCIVLVLIWITSIGSNFIIILFLIIFVGAIVVFFLSTVLTVPKLNVLSYFSKAGIAHIFDHALIVIILNIICTSSFWIYIFLFLIGFKLFLFFY